MRRFIKGFGKRYFKLSSIIAYSTAIKLNSQEVVFSLFRSDKKAQLSEIEDEEDQTVFSFTPTQEKPFEVKAALLDYQEAYGELPKKELESNQIYYYAQPDYSKYFIVYTTALSIYGVVFAVSLIGLMVYDLKKKKA